MMDLEFAKFSFVYLATIRLHEIYFIYVHFTTKFERYSTAENGNAHKYVNAKITMNMSKIPN